MKYVKLILITILILAAVIGAFLLTNSIGTRDINIFPKESLEQYRKKIQQEWEEKNDWDEELFKSQRNMVDQLSLYYSNVKPLNDMIRNIAIGVVNDKIFAEWASPTCRFKTVQKYKNAINLICKEDEAAKSDSRTININSVDKVYREAYSLAYQKVSIDPSFDGIRWNSFSVYHSKIMERRKSIYNNAHYKNSLSNISNIKNSLESIPNKLDVAKTNFYRSLESLIVNHYNAIPDTTRTYEQLLLLRNARNQYRNEFGTSNIINNCAEDFNDDVQRNNDLQ